MLGGIFFIHWMLHHLNLIKKNVNDLVEKFSGTKKIMIHLIIRMI